MSKRRLIDRAWFSKPRKDGTVTVTVDFMPGVRDRIAKAAKRAGKSEQEIFEEAFWAVIPGQAEVATA